MCGTYCYQKSTTVDAQSSIMSSHVKVCRQSQFEVASPNCTSAVRVKRLFEFLQKKLKLHYVVRYIR